MIIQNIIFPSKTFNPIVSAFMRLKNCPNYSVDDTYINMGLGSSAEFNTYFNAFSIEKWKKYTDIGSVTLRLFLKGTFSITLFNELRIQNKNIRTVLNEVFFDNREQGSIDIVLPATAEKGICGFSVKSLEENSLLLGGYYYTDKTENDFEDVIFAIDICTFRREKFVNRNLELIDDTIFSSNSPLRDKIEIFISDNGKSLELSRNYDNRVHVFPNKNAGGAGGFGRSMIEILRSSNYDKFTHIIMMDDDIVLSPETLYRTYTLTKTLKPEYKNSFIGGSMLELGRPHIQSEAMDLWTPTGSHPVKFQYNITDLSFVIKNEIEDKANYLGWWYCVMPIGVVKANNLPLPIFIKRDDIEYGIRNGRTFITLNGLCVLHEAFGNKRQGYLEYYYWRNMCILNSIHYPSYNKKTLKRQLWKVAKMNLLYYRYDDANLAFTGIEDFLKGVDWLMKTDVENLNNHILNYTYKAVPVSTLPIAFSHGLYEKSLREQKNIEKKVRNRIDVKYLKTLAFGWLKKADRQLRYVKINGTPGYMFYGVKTILNYDENSNTGFITTKSFRQALNLLNNYRKLCHLIDQKFDLTKQEYRVRYRELTSLNFWESYLSLNETASKEYVFDNESKIISGTRLLEDSLSKKSYKKDQKYLIKVYLRRFAQHCLFWIPLKKNRIFFYLHERIGFTCNLKYIAEELHRRYGKDIELVWGTKYPESCSKLEEIVVRLNTWEHWYNQFTAKAVIINDAFPESVVIRSRQVTINTWHACMNYKKIGPDYIQFRNKIAERIFRIRNKQPDMYLSGSQYFTDDTSKSFYFDPNVFVPTGSPRNDIFFQDTQIISEKIRRHYAINSDCKLALYAPTFRRGHQENSYELDFERVIANLSTRFGGTWKILYRKHYFVNGKNTVLTKNTIDVSDYDDMNELLAISDVLISDYSSCLWDFALTKRPSFVYATDIEYYRENDRDFSYPLEKWPYSISKDNDELESNILEFSEFDYMKKVEAHLLDGGTFDDGHASERAVDLLIEKMNFKNNL